MSLWILAIIFLLILITIPVTFAIAMGVAQARMARRAAEERAQLEERLRTAALAAATIVGARVLGARENGETSIVRLTLQVEPPEGESYLAVVNWEVDQPMLSYLQGGQPVSVKIDPQDPKRVYPNVSWARIAAAQ